MSVSDSQATAFPRCHAPLGLPLVSSGVEVSEDTWEPHDPRVQLDARAPVPNPGKPRGA